MSEHPRITQDAHDDYTDARAYIANMCDGAVAGFKYFDLSETTEVAIEVRCTGTGKMIVSTELHGDAVAEIEISSGKDYTWFGSALSVTGSIVPLYFTYRGDAAVDFRSLQLK